MVEYTAGPQQAMAPKHLNVETGQTLKVCYICRITSVCPHSNTYKHYSLLKHLFAVIQMGFLRTAIGIFLT